MVIFKAWEGINFLKWKRFIKFRTQYHKGQTDLGDFILLFFFCHSSTFHHLKHPPLHVKLMILPNFNLSFLIQNI